MAEQRLLNKEIDKRIVVKLDKTIKKEDKGVNGLMTFGQLNDYPQIIEKLINGSVTAKSVSRINSKFLIGQGFENEGINKIVVGTDSRGKEITIRSLLRQVAVSLSMHNGFYIHTNVNLAGEVGTVHLKPFKDCRFAKDDDEGYSAKILVYGNWEKDKNFGKYSKKNIKDFNVFNLNANVIASQVKAQEGTTPKEKLDNYKGQIYFQFNDDQYFYPLSPFDPVYLDCDTEGQIGLYKNRQTRDGFFDTIIIRTAPFATEEKEKEFTEGVIKQLGPDGDRVLILEDAIDEETGAIPEDGSYRIDSIKGNVNAKLFDSIEKSLANNIRKSADGIPAILIDYEESSLGNTSGEAVREATNFYNAITQDTRELISRSFEEIFSKSKDSTLKANTNWKINPLSLLEQLVDQTQDINAEAQAALRGSVGGVQGILSIQEGVSTGKTDRGAAIEILKEIYGFSEETSEALLGNPKTEEDDTDTNTDATE
jgi:hypothetical protein